MSEDWSYECSLIHPKYQWSTNNLYDYVINHSQRVIQLSTVAKLTTDNNSIISDFPVDYNIFGMEPYHDYLIKVNDTYDSTLYIFVHYRNSKTFLLPVVMGFHSEVSCSVMKLTDNWRARYIQGIGENKSPGIVEEMLYDTTPPSNDKNRNAYVYVDNAIDEFGVEGNMIVVETADGVYNHLAVLKNRKENGLLKAWEASETESKKTLTTFSSFSLVLQVWLHTICSWRKRCINRKIKIVCSDGTTAYSSDIKSYTNTAKQTIVDINKEITVYINNNLSKKDFRGYHMLETSRCGHFRHLPSGKITYIPPTIVHFKKINPTVNLVGCKPVVYRNTEDFLREKSYLENDVMLMLKGNGIKYEREKTFDWMGRKRLDFYLPSIRVGIECQGVQHFYPYGANDNDFEMRKKRDEDKFNECFCHDVTILYYVNPSIPVPKEHSEKHYYITSLSDLYEHIKMIVTCM